MSFENIITAAIKRDINALKKDIRQCCIDEWQIGSYFFSAASKIAFDKNIPAAEFLRKHGASINYLAQGAAQGGHRKYAEFLRARGASINYLAQGAAQGGRAGARAHVLERSARPRRPQQGDPQGKQEAETLASSPIPILKRDFNH